MIIRTSLLLFLSLLLGTTIAQISAKVQQNNKIYGVWQTNQFGYQMSLILNQDGTGEFDGESLTFSIKDNKLTVLAGSETTIYLFKLQGNALLLSGGDLQQELTFNHPGDTTNDISLNTAAPSTIRPSNSPSPATKTSDDIIGVWSGSGETIEFKSDGYCLYLGNTFPYQLNDGNLNILSSQGAGSFKCVIKGDQLTLTGSAGSVSYIRSSAKSGNSSSTPSTGNGQIAPELVGKWCFVDVNSYNQGASSTSECVTLNADGTYEYAAESSRSDNTPDSGGGTNSQNSDRGTWTYNGDRLFVQSQSKGTLSYKLEKRNHPKNVSDPMIVIDGRAFVTAYNKPPWR
ncbi:MAG: hypothetical protein ABJC12_04835 [Saprospiraceae bacterium]